MERNADDTFGATGNPGSTGGTGSMGSGSSVGSAGMSGTGASSSGLDYSASGSQTNMGSDPATTAEKAKDAVQDKFGQIKDKARNLQSRSEEHTSELQSQSNLVCRLLLEKKKK